MKRTIIILTFIIISICISYADEPSIVDCDFNLKCNKDQYSLEVSPYVPLSDPLFSTAPASNISFSDEDNHLVGTLEMKDGKLIFKGEADKAAKLFLKYLIEDYSLANCQEVKE